MEQVNIYRKLLILSLFLLCACTPDFLGRLRDLMTPKEFHVLVIGDSQSTGGIRLSGTVIPDSTLFEFVKGEYITGTYAGGFYGTMAEQTRKRANHNIYLLNAAKGGSSYSSENVNSRWGEGGSLYDRMLERTYEHEFDLIFLAVGGLDAISSRPIEDIKNEMLWVVNRLEEDFPNSKILLSKAPGGDNYSNRMSEIRAIEDSIINANPNIYNAYDIGELVDRYGREELTGGGLHFKQQYSDTIGKYNGIIISDLINSSN